MAKYIDYLDLICQNYEMFLQQKWEEQETQQELDEDEFKAQEG